MERSAQVEQERAQTEEELKKLLTPMTILFSDIKGSTAYAEKEGDFKYMAMISRHNSILFPVIEAEGGRVVKTIGDAILACFQDPVAAVKAGVGMQRVLAEDRKGRQEVDQIHIRVGLHKGEGLIKDGDVFGDVVNAASRVQHQAEVEQVLITDGLLDAVRIAGFECAKMSRAQLKGKHELIDLYAVAWSESATQQLIEQVQAQYEKKLKDARKLREQLEEDFDVAREQWRTERRNLNSEIEQLEEAVERARQSAKVHASEDLQGEIRFQLEEATRARQQLEEDLIAARKKFDAERKNLKAQIASIQASAVDAMERSNNPTRLAMAVNEKLEARLAEAKQEWQLQWEGERKRFTAEIERLRKAPSAVFEKREAARRAVLEKLGKLPPGSAGPAAPFEKAGNQLQREFEDAKIGWENERNQLNLKIKKLELERQRTQDTIRSEVFQEMRAQYEPQLAALKSERQRFEQEIQSLTNDLATERERLNARIAQLEREIPEAQEVARKQTLAELQSQFDTKVEEANRIRSRMERKQQDAAEEWEAELRRAKKQIASLEEQLREAKEAAYRAQKTSPRS